MMTASDLRTAPAAAAPRLLLRPRLAPVLVVLALASGAPGPAPAPAAAQGTDPLRTPLPERTLLLLADEVSGQAAFNNLVKLAGAPWMRTPEELSGAAGFYEADELLRMVRSYGIETVRLDRYPAPGTFEYPVEGELWVGGARLARLPADPALVAAGSRTADVTGPLVYLPAMEAGELERVLAAEPQRFRGSVALLWAHPRGELFQALDRAGVQAVVSFSARERYFDPDQVVYSRGSYGEGESLRLGMTVSWRQWSELLEDLESGVGIQVRARAVMEEYPNRFETVYAWIPGTEPQAKGVIFTAHLFEGYVKRGANDNAGGPAIQLEILRALHHLIGTGQLPRPRRTLHFVWPQEISGTYEFLRRDPALVERLAVNINMDMVSEALRKNNAVFTMSETPPHLPSFFDGLAHAVLNYLWRTNDIVYLPDSPRGRPGGQYFPRPLWEKGGTRDAFRFFIHEATGGSDHIVFNNPSVGVPGIEFFTWPDQWYHADKDLPENADPTQMRRVAFIGAATGWVSANLTDEMLPALLDAVAGFGYRRVAERGLPRAMAAFDGVGATAELESALERTVDLLAAAAAREREALASIREVWSGSVWARAFLEDRLARWDAYAQALEDQAREYAGRRAATLGAPAPGARILSPEEERLGAMVPRLAPGIRGTEFNLRSFAPFQRYLQSHPRTLEEIGLSGAQTSSILNFVSGTRTLSEIRRGAVAWTGEEMTLRQVADYLRILEKVGWVELQAP